MEGASSVRGKGVKCVTFALIKKKSVTFCARLQDRLLADIKNMTSAYKLA